MSSIVPLWSTLRAVGTSRFAQMTVLTPVFGYLILYSDVLRQFPGIGFESPTGIAHVGEYSTIYALYFGLCLLSVGTVVFQMRCAEVVKKYADQIAYVIAVTPNLSQMDCELILKQIKDSPKASQEARNRADLLVKSSALSPENNRENRVFALTEHYKLLNGSNDVARTISALCFGIGACLVIYPTLRTFWAILGSIFGW